MMGAPSSDLSGHWRDEIPGLDKGILDLFQERPNPTARAAGGDVLAKMRSAFAIAPALPIVQHTAITTAVPGKPLMLTARVHSVDGIKSVRVRYRAVDQYLEFQTLAMEPTGNADEYRAEIPGGADFGEV